MIRRPKPHETEDEILALQEEFIKEKQKPDYKPTVNIINARKHKADEEESSVPDSAKQLRTDEPPPSKDVELTDDTVHYPKVIPLMIGNVIEKNMDSLTYKIKATEELNDPIQTSKSLFAQRIRNKRAAISAPSTSTCDSKEIEQKNSDILKHSVIVKSDNFKEIHDENSELLNNMSEEQILEERKQLLSVMDPKTIEFLKSLRNKAPIKDEIAVQENMEVDVPAENKVIDNDGNLLDNEVLTHPNLHDWVNFDTLEKDKLNWMKTLKSADTPTSNTDYEARFDFKGYLLPYTAEYNEEQRTLFHHGEDPHRPGYSLRELLHLSRSAVTQQRSIALNTIAGLLDYHSIGIYDNIIDIPLAKIFFALRFSLDENIPSVFEPALKALRNLFYNRVDETCVDNLLGTENGLFQPKLFCTRTDIDESNEDVNKIKDFIGGEEMKMEEMKDYFVAELDLISGCIRTDIIQRIRYIMCTLKPGFYSIQCCFEILIRIAKHSPECAKVIVELDSLMEHIFEQYLPSFIPDKGDRKTNSELYKLICYSLKLVRILISQSVLTMVTLNTKYKLIDVLLSYIGNISATTAYLMKIQMETHYIFATFLSYEFGTEHLMRVLPFCFLNLEKSIDIISLSSCFQIMCSHTTSIIYLLNVFATTSVVHTADLIKKFDELLYKALLKWCSQIFTVEKFTFTELNLIASVFDCMGSIARRGYYSAFNDSQLKACVEKMLRSDGFDRICSHINSSSNLLSSKTTYIPPNGTNIGKYNSILFEHPDKLVPTMRSTSPIYFISSLTRFLKLYRNKDISVEFLNNKHVYKYISDICNAKTVTLHNNWFTGIEFSMLSNFLTLPMYTYISEELKDNIYKISFKLSYLLPPLHRDRLKYLINNIVFNKEWFAAHRLLNTMNLEETNVIFNDLKKIKQFYLSIFQLDDNRKVQNLFIIDWNSSILPKDWIYMPILGLHLKNIHFDISFNRKSADVFKNTFTESAVINLVLNCLKWILTCEICFPDLTCELSTTDRFCRIMCIFLCDNSVFLHDLVHPLLNKYVKIIFDLEKNSTFVFHSSQSLMGISKFFPLYNQFVEHYQAVSYGNPLFAACVLAPLAMKHPLSLRRFVWSEYAGCLRYLDCQEEMLCYPLEDFLNPPETDISLIKSYSRALNSNSLRIGTIPHKIAVHHLECAKKRRRKRLV